MTCPAIDGIISDADDIAAEIADKNVLDAALIAAPQAVEHYEITRYGTHVSWAGPLGRNDCAALLRQNLEEERATDAKLSSLAETSLKRKAAYQCALENRLGRPRSKFPPLGAEQRTAYPLREVFTR